MSGRCAGRERPAALETEIIAEGGAYAVLINGVRLRRGFTVPSALGFIGLKEGVVVDHRLLAVIAILALRKQERGDDAWVYAQELALYVDCSPDPRRINEVFSKNVVNYYEGRKGSNAGEHELRLSELSSKFPHYLLQYEPRRPEGGAGKSIGRYRLGGRVKYLSSPDIIYQLTRTDRLGVELDRDALIAPGTPMSAQLYQLSYREPLRVFDFSESIVERAQRFIIQGRLMEGWAWVYNVLYYHLALAKGGAAFLKDLPVRIAQLWAQLSDIEMELGLPWSAILSAQKAAALFIKKNHDMGLAQTFRIRAHAYGQLGDAYQALQMAQKAQRRCTRPQNRAERYQHMLSTGLVGQRLGKDGRAREAAKSLNAALRMSRTHGWRSWEVIWLFRFAESAMGAGQLALAGQAIEEGYRLAQGDLQIAAPHRVVMARVTTEFYVAQRDDEKIGLYATEGMALAERHQMHHHINTMQMRFPQVLLG